MSVRIRLARGGAKRRPFYRIVVAEKSSPRDGRFVEKVGYYNPLVKNDERVVINKERALYWLSVGAEPSDRVAKFFYDFGLVSSYQKSNNPNKAKPKKKAQEKLKKLGLST